MCDEARGLKNKVGAKWNSSPKMHFTSEVLTLAGCSAAVTCEVGMSSNPQEETLSKRVRRNLLASGVCRSTSRVEEAHFTGATHRVHVRLSTIKKPQLTTGPSSRRVCII